MLNRDFFWQSHAHPHPQVVDKDGLPNARLELSLKAKQQDPH